MPRYICHHEGKFFEWSTVVDAPITYAIDRESFEKYLKKEYGNHAFPEQAERIERAIEKGTSSLIDNNLESLLEVNRAGENSETISFDEIIKQVNTWPEEDDSNV